MLKSAEAPAAPQTSKRLHLDENGELISVRGLVSLILGYVLLYTPDVERSHVSLCFAALAAHLISNAALLWLPSRFSKASWFLPALFLADLAMISGVLSLAANAETDLYLVYFLVILMSGMQRDISLSFLVGGVASILYGFLWCKSNPVEELFGAPMLLRFPFFFIVAFFSAYFARRAQKGTLALGEAKEQLARAEKLASIGRLAAGMAHEFNNILMAISGNAALLEEALGADDERLQDARAIQDLSGKAARLVRLLLNFSLKQSVSPTRIDVRSFLIEHAARLREILGPGMEDRFELAPDLPPISADRDQIWQLLSSLAVNAREAMQGAGVFRIVAKSVARAELPPALHPTESPDYVLLAISDDGRGMTSEVSAHLFEPFVTTKPIGQGTGMSLASVYGIVRRAGGDLRVETAAGRGTTFHIYIPALPAGRKQPAGRGTSKGASRPPSAS